MKAVISPATIDIVLCAKHFRAEMKIDGAAHEGIDKRRNAAEARHFGHVAREIRRAHRCARRRYNIFNFRRCFKRSARRRRYQVVSVNGLFIHAKPKPQASMTFNRRA